MSGSDYCFLTCVQISQEAGKVVWYSHLFPIFHSLLWSTQSKALAWSMKQMFFWNSHFFFFWVSIDYFYLWSNGCWQFDLRFLWLFKSRLNIWKFLVHVLLKPSLENFEHYFASVWNECNCAVVWAFFGMAFLWDSRCGSHGAKIKTQTRLCSFWRT